LVMGECIPMTFVGIDVGGRRKGFHAAALRQGAFIDVTKSQDPDVIVQWCLGRHACVVAVDAPCRWSRSGSSRRAEREMKLNGRIVQCFKTPTRERACSQGTGFYGWVLNGERLYQRLLSHYLLFDGSQQAGMVVLETFPHAVACALKGGASDVRHKLQERRRTLRDRGYDDRRLSNIDFVDAALCSLTAEAYSNGSWQCFGDEEEGFIVIPDEK